MAKSLLEGPGDVGVDRLVEAQMAIADLGEGEARLCCQPARSSGTGECRRRRSKPWRCRPRSYISETRADRCCRRRSSCSRSLVNLNALPKPGCRYSPWVKRFLAGIKECGFAGMISASNAMHSWQPTLGTDVSNYWRCCIIWTRRPACHPANRTNRVRRPSPLLPEPLTPVGVTVHAIRHLLARAVLLRPQTRTLLFQWADWRPRHNHEARQWHYHHHFSYATVRPARSSKLDCPRTTLRGAELQALRGGFSLSMRVETGKYASLADADFVPDHRACLVIAPVSRSARLLGAFWGGSIVSQWHSRTGRRQTSAAAIGSGHSSARTNCRLRTARCGDRSNAKNDRKSPKPRISKMR